MLDTDKMAATLCHRKTLYTIVEIGIAPHHETVMKNDETEMSHWTNDGYMSY